MWRSTGEIAKGMFCVKKNEKSILERRREGFKKASKKIDRSFKQLQASQENTEASQVNQSRWDSESKSSTSAKNNASRVERGRRANNDKPVLPPSRKRSKSPEK
jgi:hypothetical protein